MEKVAGHTKGEWYVSGDDEFDGVPFIEISCGECPSPEYRSICHVQPQFDEGTDGFELDGEARANAAFIVQAVNSHDELVAALKSALTQLDMVGRHFPGCTADECSCGLREEINRARNSLSRATKQEG